MSATGAGADDVAPAKETEAPQRPAALPFRTLLALHGGLCLTIVIWSFMHVIMCVACAHAALRTVCVLV